VFKSSLQVEQDTTYTVVSVRGGSTKFPHSISFDLVRRSIKAPNILLKILSLSFTFGAS